MQKEICQVTTDLLRHATSSAPACRQARARRARHSRGQSWLLLIGALLLAMLGHAGYAANSQEQAALDQINLRRGQLGLPAASGLPALDYNAFLEQSSRAHANYLALNNEQGHIETGTLPGFTGELPYDRIGATGYGAPTVSSEVISFGPATGVDAIESLIQAIYHRFGIFMTNVDEQGAGFITNHPQFGGKVLVVNVATSFTQPPVMSNSWRGVYPFDGQTNVTRDFFPNTESPNPVPEAGTAATGYPISFHIDANRTLAVTSFTVKPVSGSDLPVKLLTASADTSGNPPTDTSGHTPVSVAAIIPLAPLAYGTQYEAHFTGTAENGATLIDHTWRFTTVPLLPISFLPSQPYVAIGGTIQIAISGGSGQSSSLSTSYFDPLPANVDFLDTKTLRVTGLAAGTIDVTITDNEGHTETVTIHVQASVDQTPDAFAFAPVTGAPLTTVVESAQATVTGINAPTAISIAGGEYAINGGTYTTQPGSVVNGDTVRVRLTSSGFNATLSSATLTVGGVSAVFNVTTLPAGFLSSTPNLEAGFNLMGNSFNTSLNVAATFGNQDSPVAGVTENIATVWKWNALDQRWAFYSPLLSVAGNLAYAASRNYDLLASVAPGEGYWVNAIVPISLPAQVGAGLNYDCTGLAALPAAFNLLAIADALTPSQFANNLSCVAIATLWSWDAAGTKWYFHSPLLEASGGLAAVKNYADSHNFLHFPDSGKKLGLGVGFWINKL